MKLPRTRLFPFQDVASGNVVLPALNAMAGVPLSGRGRPEVHGSCTRIIKWNAAGTPGQTNPSGLNLTISLSRQLKTGCAKSVIPGFRKQLCLGRPAEGRKRGWPAAVSERHCTGKTLVCRATIALLLLGAILNIP